MGYSCTASANNALDFLMDMITDPNGSSNTWTHDFAAYFFERGDENADGSITGTVYRSEKLTVTEAYKKHYAHVAAEVGDEIDVAYTAGSVRIEPDGKVTRFSRLPAWARANVNEAYKHGALEDYHTRRQMTGSAI
ncbi:MAG: hypothetical protein V3S71_02780 [Acidobacteriota bacterium]